MLSSVSYCSDSIAYITGWIRSQSDELGEELSISDGRVVAKVADAGEKSLRSR